MESLPENRDGDDYSPALTIITFSRPISLLRGPVRAGRSENPSSGPFLLAFKNPRAWESAFRKCEFEIIEQCVSGARIGCSIAASNKCKPPWWGFLIGSKKGFDLKEKELCEEREMEICLDLAKEKCVGFAKEKCSKPFMEARIVGRGRKVMEKEAKKWVNWVLMADKDSLLPLIELDLKFSRFDLEETTYRASEII